MQVLPLRQSDRDDMMWREYLVFVINLMCAGYFIAADEINFQPFFTRGAGLATDAGAERVAYAQETGLHELLRQMFFTVNMAVVRKFYADDETGLGPYEIAPTGIEQKDEAAEDERRIARLNGGLSSLNQELTEQDKPVVRDPVNRDLWERIEAAVLRKAPKLTQDPIHLDEIVSEIYRNHGGKLRQWTDLPVAFSMQQARQQEMQEEQGEEGAGGEEDDGQVPPEFMQQLAGGEQEQGKQGKQEQPEPLRRSLGARVKRGLKKLNPLRWFAGKDAAVDEDGIETLNVYFDER